MTIRVLHVLAGLNSGGTESFIMNVYRNIDRNKIQFDFLLRQDSDPCTVKEVVAMGGRIYTLPPFPKKILGNYLELKRFFKERAAEYQVVHVHCNSLIYIAPLFEAKKYNIPCRIVHSHNTQGANFRFVKYIHKFNKIRIKKLVTERFACSKLAGDWMFNDSFKVINNAIDVNKFKFNLQDREQIRKEFGIHGKFVIGHIGRFVEQKNHEFLVNIFHEVAKLDNDAVLLLIGEGPLQSKIRSKVEIEGLSEKIIFADSRKDIPNLLSAMDVMVLPSNFEGLGIVLVEAQASGIKAITSKDVVPLEAKTTDLLEYLPLGAPVQLWADKILSNKEPYIRDDKFVEIKANGYEISDLVERLQSFYLGNHGEV
ncbi:MULTISPECIES: glycosyltransferase family 1 protein [unclassified Vibrio]|uniref:glycosyltransferase family 1 protein n=3 Tax=Vibrio TaxID=662 RepID=UPI001E46DD02|nr:glycosyltransferase family 1 protein [Vibrio sp. F13]MCC4892278.1 glycosyltransferase family 1 protein [Vibrio sp. F13]